MKFLSHSILSTLGLLLVFFVIVPSLLTGFGAIGIYQTQQQELIRENLAETTKGIASEFDSYILVAERTLSSMTSAVDFTDLGKANYLLDTILDEYNIYEEIKIADANGIVQHRISRNYSYRPEEFGSVSGEEAFITARGGEVYYGGLHQTQYSNLPVVTIAVPLYGLQGAVIGTALADVSVNTLWQNFSVSRVGENKLAYVVDRAGKLIASQDTSTVLSRNDDMKNIEIVRSYLVDVPQDGTYIGLKDEEVLGAYSQVSKLNWGVVLEYPTRIAFEQINYTRYLVIGVAILSACVAIAAGLFFSFRSIVSPLQELERVSKEISDGNLSQRVSISTHNEIGRLAERFNEMTSRLQEGYLMLEQKVAERTKELNVRADQLERMNKLMVGRELKMIQLKKRIGEPQKDVESEKSGEDKESV